MKTKIILLIIVLTAAFLRFFQLDTIPPSLTWDEVAWGYNAYALGIDGSDEFGRFLPIDYIESFGDFKPPVYAYLDILPIKIFGLSEFAVRFPSALFGSLTVLITYFLVKRIFPNAKYKEQYALITSGLLAISPWHILLSRAAFEANVASFFIIFCIFSFLKGIQDKSWHFILFPASFVLAMYTFNTPRIVAPLIGAVLLFLYRKQIIKLKKTTAFAFILAIFFLLPAIPFLLSPQARLRYEEVNIFSNIELVKTANQYTENNNNAWWSNILHNRRVVYVREYIKHYFDNLSINFLFIKGDGNIKFSTQDVGQMYLWELPFLIIGTLLLIRRKEGNWFIIPIWLLIGIIPAATARETPHALRIETTLPTFQILVSYAIVNAAFSLKKYRKHFIGTVSIVAAAAFTYFLHVYFVQYPWEFSGEWQYGYKDSINYVKSVENQYDHIAVTNSLGRPYIYYLFYLKIPPKEFRESAKIKRDPFGFVTVEGFTKYSFTNKTIINNSGKTLYVISASEQIPASAKKLKTFYKLDGTPVLYAFTI
jgi:4-amino-4-deoxy-L-arabinose transferase-like glycosyltransferase